MTRTLRYPDYQIAAGHDNEAGLVAWENLIADDATRYMIPPTIRGGFNPGQILIRGDGTEYLAGHQSLAQVFTWVSYAEDLMLQEDICGAVGSYSGPVTLRARLSPAGSYANYNAIIHLPKPNERDEAVGRINNYRILYTRLTVIPV